MDYPYLINYIGMPWSLRMQRQEQRLVSFYRNQTQWLWVPPISQQIGTPLISSMAVNESNKYIRMGKLPCRM